MTGRDLGRLAGAAVVIAAIAAAPPLAYGQAAGAAKLAPTFTKDVAPIFQEKCESCHRPNNMAPMSLVTYEEVRPWVRSIRTRVMNQEMPPWHLDKTVGIQKFINDRSLSDAEIDAIVRWIDAGAPRGAMADMPPPKQWPSGDRFLLEEKLGPPDLVVRSKPYTMTARAPDVAIESIVDVPELTEPRWVRAAETKPSLVGRRIVHHANTYLLRPQTPEAVEADRAARAGQPGADFATAIRRSPSGIEKEMFTEWAQGKDGELYPANVGKLVMPATKVGFQVHYHAVGEEITDTLEVAWWFHPKGTRPRYSAEYASVGAVPGGSVAIQIPPHTITEHQGTTVLQAPAILHNFQPHMHYRGKAQTLEAIYPDGRREVINQVTRYTNNWHINYIYDPDYAPVFPKGTVLLVTSVHDNTAANKNNPDPRQWVSGGDRTVDEMAHLNQQIIYITDEDYHRIIGERKKRTATQN
jgi:mono/diheme cytochrome c family protein